MLRSGSALAALAALFLYLSFCPPVSGTGDSSEFTLVLATGGVAHPTGYPLYTLFGHFFCVAVHRLGVAWPLAANAWSAAGGALAVWFLHSLALALAGRGPRARPFSQSLAALLPIVPFALSPVVMDGATTAEINIWTVAWAAGASRAFVALLGRIAAAGDGRGAPGLAGPAALWGLVCGTGAAHHATTVLVAAPLSAGLLVALAMRRRLSTGLVLAGIGGALVPLASYGIIAWRAWHPALVQWPSLAPSWESVLRHVTGAPYRLFFGFFAPAPGNLLARAVYPLLFPGLALLLLGALRAREWDRRVAWWSLLAAASTVTAFSFRYGVPDPEPYFLPAGARGAAAAGAGLAALAGARFLNGWLRAAAALVAVAALVPVARPWLTEAAGVRREAIDYDAMIRSMWAAIPPDTAIVFWRDDRVIRLREYQLLRGEKPALYVETPDVLIDESTRLRFYRRFGFDPIEGLRVPYIRPNDPDAEAAGTRFIRQLVRNVNERTRIPVIIFDPGIPIVRRLYKPWEPAEDAP